MGNALTRRIEHPWQVLALVATAGCALSYLVIARARVTYPYDLDFIEDGLLMQALRVAEGQPVFVPPNAEFVPHVYMPLYTWLGGLLVLVTGPDLEPIRKPILVVEYLPSTLEDAAHDGPTC